MKCNLNPKLYGKEIQNMHMAGMHASGRLPDGKEWNPFPPLMDKAIFQ
jgi:hypothetical protein